MSRVFTSPSTGASVYVFSDDHCPPHVHARHRGDGWVARVRFSFADSEVELLSIAPLKSVPLRRTVNGLLDEIETELPACRHDWWRIRQTTCLANQWAREMSDRLELLPAPASEPDARQIAEAIYDPDREQLRVTFQDGATLDVRVSR
jgi:hypothetical protein